MRSATSPPFAARRTPPADAALALGAAGLALLPVALLLVADDAVFGAALTFD